ncbi:uncharacterized protein LOC117975918 [Pan paniscus]|uniref:uncharacterized protein LOC117975918 n=1 Tax=Pan paniscus TaxID=9597 RepID=UPI0030059B65
MMIIPHLLRDKDQRATTATSPRTRQCWGTENEGVQLWPSQSSGGDETHLPLSLWARLMPGASVDRGHAPGLPKLEKAARLRSEGQNSTVSPTESRWEQGRWLPRLCGRIRFLAVEVACTPQLVLPVSNDWSFLLLLLHLPPSPSPALLLQQSSAPHSLASLTNSLHPDSLRPVHCGWGWRGGNGRLPCVHWTPGISTALTLELEGAPGKPTEAQWCLWLPGAYPSSSLAVRESCNHPSAGFITEKETQIGPPLLLGSMGT